MTKVPRAVRHTVHTILEQGITVVIITPSLPQGCPGLDSFGKLFVFALILCPLRKRWLGTRGGL